MKASSDIALFTTTLPGPASLPLMTVTTRLRPRTHRRRRKVSVVMHRPWSATGGHEWATAPDGLGRAGRRAVRDDPGWTEPRSEHGADGRCGALGAGAVDLLRQHVDSLPVHHADSGPGAEW